MEQAVFLFPAKDEIPDSVIVASKDFKSAVRLCIEVSGLERKQVAAALDLQDPHLSRMLADSNGSDERHFPLNKIEALMDICGNTIPVRWLALKRGYGLHRLKTALEVENEQLKAELQEREKEMATMMKLVKEIRS